MDNRHLSNITNLKQGVCHHTVALRFTLKKYLKAKKKKNYGKSNISRFKNIIFKKKSSKKILKILL